MAVNYCGICVTNVIKQNLTYDVYSMISPKMAVIYCNILTLEKVGLKLPQ